MAAGAIEQLGKKDKIVNGSLGLSVNALQALHDGKILFIADLQPYLDGYYAVVEAYQYAKYGMLPAGELQRSMPEPRTSAHSIQSFGSGVFSPRALVAIAVRSIAAKASSAREAFGRV